MFTHWEKGSSLIIIHYLHSQKSIEHELKELCSDDLATIHHELISVAGRCITFGVQLGVSDSNIRSIITNNNDCKDQLYKILAQRLCQAPKLTWPDIVAVLQSDAIKEEVLANRIMCQYVSHHHPAAVPTLKASKNPFLH